MFEDELGDVFYDKDGSFKPFTDAHGNVSGLLAHMRNTYMEAEREYFTALLRIPSMLRKFRTFLTLDSDALLKKASEIQMDLETGLLETPEELEKMSKMTPEEKDKFHMDRLEAAEGMMCLLYAAARDKVRILELVKEIDYDLERDNNEGRSR